MKNKIGAIVVLYNPNWVLTEKVILAVLPQVHMLYIVDNSPTPSSKDIFQNPKIQYEFLGGNKGIAFAQNEGLKMLQDDNLDFCFFLDQDSIVEDNMIQILVNHYQNLVKRGFYVGAIGPRPVNRQQGKEYRGSVKKGVSIDKDTTEVTELISSASLIPIDNLKKVGNMDTSLFIDGVDHEWCWRCSKLTGARFFISEKTHLSHQLGEGDKKFLWRKVAIPTPFRTYYQFRNYFILVTRGYVPLYWKLSNGLKYIIKMFYYPIFTPPRKAYLKNIYSGISDGIKSIFQK